jgi:hypothetical protein
MLSPGEFASQIDGPSVEREISRIGSQGSAYLDLARTLSSRVNNTAGWKPLGPAGARYELLAVRGEAVVFLDGQTNDRVVKLRGREENGFNAGFGCILGRNKMGRVDLVPGTLEQALEREFLTWQAFGFGCRVDSIIGDGEREDGLLLGQTFVEGDSPTPAEIQLWMKQRGWHWQNASRDISPPLCSTAWVRDGIAAFDAEPSNFIRNKSDKEIYPIDLVVCHWPD